MEDKPIIKLEFETAGAVRVELSSTSLENLNVIANSILSKR